MKRLLLIITLFIASFSNSQEIVRIKESGFGDIDIRIKRSGFGDIDVRFKESGFGDFSVGFTNNRYRADFVLKHSGFGDRSIRIKESGFGDIDVRIKESGFGDVDIVIRNTGIADYLIYSDRQYVSKSEIVAALIDVIKREAGYQE